MRLVGLLVVGLVELLLVLFVVLLVAMPH